MDTSKIKADLHVHTLASLHAYSSLRDITKAAQWRGLQYVAITDHFYGDTGYGLMPKQESSRLKVLNGNGVCQPLNLHDEPVDRITAEYYPYECGIISGVELNFGHICKYPEVIKTLGLRLGGFHNWFYDYDLKLSDICLIEDLQGWDRIYKAISVCPMDIIVHPERDLDKLFGDNMNDKKQFLEMIVQYAYTHNKILELNEASIRRNNPVSKELMLFWIKLAKEKDIKISLGSDAHIDALVGGFRNVVDVIDEVKYPEELIVNTDLKWLESLAKPYSKDM